MRIGLANIPFWAFPLTDEGWKRLEEMPLFQAFDDFSNNAPDSRWFPVADHREEMEYIVARLRKRGKRYRLVLLDRNWSLAEFVYDRWIAAVPSLDQDFRADSHPSDDGIRREVLTGIKRGDPEVWENAIRAAREVLSLGTGEYIVLSTNISRGTCDTSTAPASLPTRSSGCSSSGVPTSTPRTFGIGTGCCA